LAATLPSAAISDHNTTPTHPAVLTPLPLLLLLGRAHPPHTQDFGLHKYASKFADAGLAAFVFDYRGWGGSSGESV
jgi:alpha/beta superfamily hydrolase